MVARADVPIFAWRGCVVAGARLGRLLGAPTANLRLPFRPVRLRGTFAAVVEGLGGPRAAVAHLGVRPSIVEGGEPLLEVHLLDFDGDLYGRELLVKLAHKVSDEARLDSVEALAHKIAQDVAAVRAYFASVSKRGARERRMPSRANARVRPAGAVPGAPDAGGAPEGRS